MLSALEALLFTRAASQDFQRTPWAVCFDLCWRRVSLYLLVCSLWYLCVVRYEESRCAEWTCSEEAKAQEKSCNYEPIALEKERTFSWISLVAVMTREQMSWYSPQKSQSLFVEPEFVIVCRGGEVGISPTLKLLLSLNL